jgi:hypothetical protein
MVRQSHGVDVGGESGTLGWKKLLTRHCIVSVLCCVQIIKNVSQINHRFSYCHTFLPQAGNTQPGENHNGHHEANKASSFQAMEVAYKLV